MTTTLGATGLPFEEAIVFLRQKTNVTSEGWADVYGAANTKAFTVAGAATDALVGDFRNAVAKAIEDGTSLGEFRKSFDDIVKRHGWDHVGSPGWRARIIFETNLGSAYAAGRWAQQTEPETLAAFPFLQYVHSGNVHFRPDHKSWNGITLRADDPWWDTHYAPNGWGCGCWVRSVSARQLARIGKSGPDTAPPVAWRDWVNPRTGEVQRVVQGIDPGFEYNPGRQWKAERVDIPANATLRPPAPIEPAALPGNPTPAAAVEDFVRGVLAGDINDPARAIYAAELPARLAAHLSGLGGSRVEISAFRVLKVAGRAPEMLGKASTAHPEITARIWSRLQQMLDEGEAWYSERHGWPGIEVALDIDGRPYVAVIRRVLQGDGTMRLDVPTFHRINAKRLAQMRAGRHGRVRIEK